MFDGIFDNSPPTEPTHNPDSEPSALPTEDQKASSEPTSQEKASDAASADADVTVEHVDHVRVIRCSSCRGIAPASLVSALCFGVSAVPDPLPLHSRTHAACERHWLQSGQQRPVLFIS